MSDHIMTFERYLKIITETKRLVSLVPDHQACGVDSYSMRDAVFEALDSEIFTNDEIQAVYDGELSIKDSRDIFLHMETERFIKQERDHQDGLELLYECYEFWIEEEDMKT